MKIPLSKSEKIKIGSSDDMYEVMQKLLKRELRIDRTREHFWTIGLDTRNKVQYIELVSMGTVNATLVEPMEVYSIALQKKCTGLILIHNHPSGEINPSVADKNITDRLIQVGNIVNIKVLDHLIIAEKTYYSFNDTGLLDKLKESKMFVPDYKLKADLKKEVEEIVKKETETKRNKEIARIMKEEGYNTEQIKKLTGLNEKEIKKLKTTKPDEKR